MDIFAGIVAIVLYLFVSGSGHHVETNLKEVVVNSRFGHNETKVINNKHYIWVDQTNVNLVLFEMSWVVRTISTPKGTLTSTLKKSMKKTV